MLPVGECLFLAKNVSSPYRPVTVSGMFDCPVQNGRNVWCEKSLSTRARRSDLIRETTVAGGRKVGQAAQIASTPASYCCASGQPGHTKDPDYIVVIDMKM